MICIWFIIFLCHPLILWELLIGGGVWGGQFIWNILTDCIQCTGQVKLLLYILNLMSMSSNSNPSYCYSKSISVFSQTFETTNQLNSTSRTSYCSIGHPTLSQNSSKMSIKRKDQLRPTSKLNINHQFMRDQPKHADDKKQVMDKMISNITYDSIKPVIGFSKYFNFCGMQKGEGPQGCQCFREPCEWSVKWTKNCNPKNKKLYRNLCAERYDLKIADQIQKDLPRTYPDCPTFAMNYQFRCKLRNILRIYTIYDMQVSYVQGMNMVAAVLLYHIKNEEEAFWAFVDLMDQQELRLIYLPGFDKLKQHCRLITKIIETKINDLYQLMIELDVNPETFLIGWLLSLMSNCVPLQFMHLVVQKFRVGGWLFMYKLIVTYLLFLKNALLMSDDCAEFYTQISNTNSKDLGRYWTEILESCHKLEI